MGGKRNKSPKVDTNPASDKLVDLLASILECSGVWSSRAKKDNPWDSLASSLEELAKQLEQLESAETNFDEHDVLHDDLLLGVEQAAQDVRARGEIFLVEIKENSPELALCQELELICHSKEFSRLRPLSRSLMSAMRYQRCLAGDVLQNIWQSLSHLHNDDHSNLPNTKDLIADISHDSLLIRRRCLDPKSSPWKDAIVFLEQLGAECQSTQSSNAMSKSKPVHAGPHPSRSTSVTADEAKGKPKTPPNPLVSSPSIIEAVRAFAFHDAPSVQKTFSILLVGAEGSGKTYCCNEIENMVPPHVHVVRPSLPFDAMGLSVGSAEDLLISMVTFARTSSKQSILLLDDVENICGHEYDGPSKSVAYNGGARTSGGEPHVTARVRSVLLSLLEILHKGGEAGHEMLLICTSTANLGKTVDRFDRIFTLAAPSAQERREVISQHISIVEHPEATLSTPGARIEALLSSLTDCTSGLSYAELSQYCREAVLTNSEKDDHSSQKDQAGSLGFLEALKRQLQSSMPESLRNDVNADFVDMQVMSARDLREMSGVFTPEGPIGLPLFGSSAEAAWQELRRLIVMPICRAKALDKLMFQHGGSGGKVFAGGVLITGPPGCGKSALAYHCAAIAASINPSVKLIDVSCTSLIHKEVGSSERAIHRLFKSARSAAPCIMLMDGIENVAAVRGNDNTTEGTMDRVLSTLLTELDGVDNEHFSQDNPACLAIIAITHNANWVDPALRRPGRLERIIELGRPEHEARRKLILKELEETAYTSEDGGDGRLNTLESLAEHVASETEGFTGAGVIAVCNEAKMISSKEWCECRDTNSLNLTPQHMMTAIEVQRSCQR